MTVSASKPSSSWVERERVAPLCDRLLLVRFAADYSDDQGPMSLSRSPIVAAVVLSGLFLYCLAVPSLGTS
jgi:hypothetical protein